MLLLDLNVLLYAFSPTFDQHGAVRTWLLARGQGDQPVLIPDVVLSGFVRIVTGGKVTAIAEPLERTIAFCDALLGLPACRLHHAGDRHWQIFAGLCRDVGATGNMVPDAFIAAMALEADAELVSFDGDFRRFPGLKIGSVPR